MDALIGQDGAIKVLQSALDSDRMHHAWIFHGPAGVGKATMARSLARILLEDQGGLGQIHDDWDHADLHVIQKELAAVSQITQLRSRKQMNIPIDLLRERMIGGWVGSGDGRRYFDPPIGSKPLAGQGKIFVIDEAELLDGPGQNALLKTLEEPPANTWIFLITANEHQLLPTIRSRCQRVGFSRLENPDMDRWFDVFADAQSKVSQIRLDELNAQKKKPKAVKTEIERLEDWQLRLNVKQENRLWMMRFADGCPGRAALALRYGIDRWAEAIAGPIKQVATGRPSPDLGRIMAELVDHYAMAWVLDHHNASKNAANKAAVRHMLALIGQMCRLAIHATVKRHPEGDSGDQEISPWMRGLDLIQEAEMNLKANVSVPLLLDQMSIAWAAGVWSKQALVS